MDLHTQGDCDYWTRRIKVNESWHERGPGGQMRRYVELAEPIPKVSASPRCPVCGKPPPSNEPG